MTVIERVAGVLRLQPSAFEEIEADHRANSQALAIVVLGTLAAGLGGGQYGLGRMVLESVGAVIGLITWAAMTYRPCSPRSAPYRSSDERYLSSCRCGCSARSRLGCGKRWITTVRSARSSS